MEVNYPVVHTAGLQIFWNTKRGLLIPPIEMLCIILCIGVEYLYLSLLDSFNCLFIS
jgi:hypothetical protein